MEWYQQGMNDFYSILSGVFKVAEFYAYLCILVVAHRFAFGCWSGLKYENPYIKKDK